MSKHTAGPWFAGPEPIGCTGPDVFHEVNGLSFSICDVFGETREERQANANLIAHAPEMYEFIESLENDAGQIPEFMWKWRNEIVDEINGDD